MVITASKKAGAPRYQGSVFIKNCNPAFENQIVISSYLIYVYNGNMVFLGNA